MVTLLQIVSIDPLERAILCINVSLVVIQQERKRRHREASSSNDLDSGSTEFEEWVNKKPLDVTQIFARLKWYPHTKQKTGLREL